MSRPYRRERHHRQSMFRHLKFKRSPDSLHRRMQLQYLLTALCRVLYHPQRRLQCRKHSLHHLLGQCNIHWDRD